MPRYGSRPDAEAIANADKSKIVSPELREARRQHALRVAEKIKADREGRERAGE